MPDHQPLRGLGVALVTPFLETGEIDYPATKNLIEYIVSQGANFLVVLGTTGETPTLSDTEQNAFVRAVVESVAGRVPIVVGKSGNNTGRLIHELQRFDFTGVDYILSAVPAYNKPQQEGIYMHFEAVAQHSPRPVILYNIPGRTGTNMSAHTTLTLAQLENVVGIKEASGDLEQVCEILANRPEGFMLYSGEDSLTLPMMAMGADGVISVAGNIVPEHFSQLVNLALENDCHASAKIQAKLLPLIRLLFEEGNPAGVKNALTHMKLCEETVRLPLVMVSNELSDKIREELIRLSHQK